jgi:glycosyltransferase involved in cell wall biosynthesis
MLDGEGANVIQSAEAGLVCPAGDSAGLAQSVLQLAAMPKLERLRLGSNGSNYANREFNREVLMNRLESWFVELELKKRMHQREV